MSRACAAAVLVVLTLAAAMPAAAADRPAAAFHKCGNILPITSWGVEAKRVGCTRAREVVRTYVRRILEDGDEDTNSGTVGAFRCRLSGTYGDGGLYRCVADRNRVIRFSRGG